VTTFYSALYKSSISALEVFLKRCALYKSTFYLLTYLPVSIVITVLWVIIGTALSRQTQATAAAPLWISSTSVCLGRVTVSLTTCITVMPDMLQSCSLVVYGGGSSPKILGEGALHAPSAPSSPSPFYPFSETEKYEHRQLRSWFGHWVKLGDKTVWHCISSVTFENFPASFWIWWVGWPTSESGGTCPPPLPQRRTVLCMLW